MCSIPDPRLADIGTAIDALAEDAAGQGVDTADILAGRLAELWAMVAAVDPELAQRLPGYRALLCRKKLRPGRYGRA